MIDHRAVTRAAAVPVFLALILPAQAQSGKIQSHQTRDANGNAVIVIHETRPEVLARQREQTRLAQEARLARKRQKKELEVARLQVQLRAQAEAELQTSASGWARPGELPPRVFDHTSKTPSYRNGGISSFDLGSFGSSLGDYNYDGWHSDYSYPAQTECPPCPRPVCP
jgi:hypothetical protein